MSIWEVTATGGGDCDREEIRRFLQLLIVEPDNAYCICASPHWRGEAHLGSDIDALVASVEGMSDSTGVYVNVNPALANWAGFIGNKHPKNEHIVKRTWLFIDLDTARAEGFQKHSATDDEKEQTRQAASVILNDLVRQGWPSPIVNDSGNGYHLLFRVDLPVNKDIKSTFSKVLKKLRKCYSERYKFDIDTSVHDEKRIIKIPGTIAKKGTSTLDRPYRMARILHVPESIELLTLEQIGAYLGTELETEDESEILPPLPRWIVSASTDEKQAYVSAAVRGEAAILSLTPASGGKWQGRNNQLYRSAFKLAGFIPMGYLTEQRVIDALMDASHACGLVEDDGEQAALKTIKNGITAGKEDCVREFPESTQAKAAEADVRVQEILQVKKPEEQQVADGELPEIPTVGDYLRMNIPPIRWAVPGLLGEGLNILAGKPKLGKSWMALNLGLTIAAGGVALGEAETEPGNVLYLALEDHARRVQGRCRKILNRELSSATEAWMERMQIATQWKRQDGGGLELIARWIRQAENPRLVIVDVWSKFRPVIPGQGNAYQIDYDHASQVKKMADWGKVAVLVLHHCKKAKADDVVDEISGTLGLAGAADGLMILTRTRGENEASLYIDGRDVSNKELTLEFDPKICSWKSLGEAEEVTQSKIKREIIAFLKMFPGRAYTAGAIYDSICDQLNKSTEQSSIRVNCNRLVKEGTLERPPNTQGKFFYPRELREDETAF